MSKDENKNDNGNKKTPAEMVVQVLVFGLFVFLLIGMVAAGLYVLFAVLRPFDMTVLYREKLGYTLKEVSKKNRYYRFKAL